MGVSLDTSVSTHLGSYIADPYRGMRHLLKLGPAVREDQGSEPGRQRVRLPFQIFRDYPNRGHIAVDCYVNGVAAYRRPYGESELEPWGWQPFRLPPRDVQRSDETSRDVPSGAEGRGVRSKYDPADGSDGNHPFAQEDERGVPPRHLPPGAMGPPLPPGWEPPEWLREAEANTEPPEPQAPEWGAPDWLRQEDLGAAEVPEDQRGGANVIRMTLTPPGERARGVRHLRAAPTSLGDTLDVLGTIHRAFTLAQSAISHDPRFPVRLQFWFQTRSEVSDDIGGPKPAVRFAIKYLEPGSTALTGNGEDYARTTTLEVRIVRAAWVPREEPGPSREVAPCSARCATARGQLWTA